MGNSKMKLGEVVTVNIPFSYTIGEEGPVTGKILETIEDCKNEVLSEIENENFNSGNVYLKVEN